jgi:aminomethyltransferase
MNSTRPWTSPIGLAHRLPVAVEVRDGCETALRFDTLEREYRRVRETIAISDASHYGKFKISGPEALTLLDRVNFIDVSRIPIQKMGLSLMLEADGRVMADTYIYNRGADYLLLTEGREPEAIAEVLNAAAAEIGDVEMTDQTRSLAMIDLSGPYSWELLKELAGMRIVGLRYMEAYEKQKIADIPVSILRAGKTGEFGYLLLVSEDQAAALWTVLVEASKAFKGAVCGTEALDLCRLENRFMNPRREGLEAANPLELNYRVMISRDKPEYTGREALTEALDAGVSRRVVGLAFDGEGVPPVGTPIVLGEEAVGIVVNAAHSIGLGKPIGLALIESPAAYVGLDFRAEAEGATWQARSVSAPFMMNRSSAIRPNEDSFHGADLDLAGLDD